MKHQVRDSIIMLFDVLGISALYRLLQSRKGPLVRILAFHDVADKKWFEAVVEMIHTNFHVITPQQFRTKEFDQKKINVLLTFDDGYQSWIENCLPVLKEHNLKGLFFINSGLLDIAQDKGKVEDYMKTRLLISPKNPLTWDGAKTLVSEGHTIGGHTVSHPNLALLSSDEVKSEVSEDKSRLESELGIKVDDFAYPFGTRKHIGLYAPLEVQKAGYSNQYSAITGFVSPEIPVELNIYPRTLLEKNQEVKAVQRWITGGYDMFNLLYRRT